MGANPKTAAFRLVDKYDEYNCRYKQIQRKTIIPFIWWKCDDYGRFAIGHNRGVKQYCDELAEKDMQVLIKRFT